LDEKESRPFIRRALEAGINFFDTADIYGELHTPTIAPEVPKNNKR
jgi:aryl-alcohol dehydrogenase-like predicted oxidoreductase